MKDNSEIEPIPELKVLDDLISNYYKQLLKKGEEPVKLGDLLKMIELKRKLSPENSEQKKFWKMLNKIRKENLQKNDAPSQYDLQAKNEK